ncbi:MAG: hypothetical protein ABEK59_02780 [Halobacteria archaeon]
MRRETAIILFLIALVTIPTWALSLFGGEFDSTNVKVNESVNNHIDPTRGFIPTPTEVGAYVSGFLSWMALFAILGLLFIQVRKMHSKRRKEERVQGVSASNLPHLPSYIETSYRKVDSYWPVPANADHTGFGYVGGFLVLTVIFAVLIALEVFYGLARTQYIGFYSAAMFFSLSAGVTMYTKYFMPDVEVAENRNH